MSRKYRSPETQGEGYRTHTFRKYEWYDCIWRKDRYLVLSSRLELWRTIEHIWCAPNWSRYWVDTPLSWLRECETTLLLPLSDKRSMEIMECSRLSRRMMWLELYQSISPPIRSTSDDYGTRMGTAQTDKVRWSHHLRIDDYQSHWILIPSYGT